MDYNQFYGTVISTNGRITRGTSLPAIMNAITMRAYVTEAPALMTAVAAPVRENESSMIRAKYHRLISGADPTLPTAQERALSAPSRPRSDAESASGVTGSGRYRFTPSRYRR
jgi:hypothetical protein